MSNGGSRASRASHAPSWGLQVVLGYRPVPT